MALYFLFEIVTTLHLTEQMKKHIILKEFNCIIKSWLSLRLKALGVNFDRR